MSKSPELSSGKAALRVARTERLARALRENLQRRKQSAAASVKDAAAGDRSSATLSGATHSSKSSGCGANTADE